MQTRRRSFLRLGWVLLAPPVWSVTSPAIDLDIASDGDNLAFRPDRLSCETGARVRLRFRHTGQVLSDPHDWVLLRQGMEAAFLADADRQADDGAVLPARDRKMILAATPLCAKGHAVVVTFVAPEPGDYPFVCSVPGHGESMHGILTVLPRSVARTLRRL